MEKKNIKTKGFEGLKVSNANGKLIIMDHIVERFVVRLHSYKGEIVHLSLEGVSTHNFRSTMVV